MLGDFAAIGPDPLGALSRVERLPGLRAVRGNTEDYLIDGTRPGPTIADAQRDPTLVRQLLDTHASLAWTAGALAGTRWPAWLTALPIEQRLTLPDGTRMLGVHAAPGTAHGDGVPPTLSGEQLASLVAGCQADLVIVGHTHWPLDRTIGGVRVVNLGSLSNPPAPDLRAKYTILEADSSGYRLDHRRVEYDHAAVIAAAEAVGHPGGAKIAAFQRGERKPPWAS